MLSNKDLDLLAKETEIERLGRNVAVAQAETAEVQQQLHKVLQDREVADMRLGMCKLVDNVACSIMELMSALSND